MILCPRCSTMVDERTRTTCPRCFAPVSATPPSPPGQVYPVQAPPSVPPLAPPPGYLPPPGSPYPAQSGMAPPPLQQPGNLPPLPMQPPPPQAMGTPAPYGQPTRTRVSLTGEVIQDAAPPPYSGSPGMSAPYPGAGQTQPGGYPRPAPAKTKFGGRNLGLSVGGGGLVVVIVLLRIGLIVTRNMHYFTGSNGNGNSSVSAPFHFGSVESNPFADQMKDPANSARETLDALKNHDWRKFYYLCSFENNENKTEAEASDFVSEFNRVTRSSPNAQTFDRAMSSMTDIVIGTAKLQGTMASASTASTLHVDGATLSLHGTANLVQVDGKWMVNMRDAGQSTSFMFKELIGLNNMQTTGSARNIFPSGDGGFFSPPVHHFTPGGFSRQPAPPGTPPGFNNPAQDIPSPPVMPSPPSGFGPGTIPHGPSNMPGPPSGYGPGTMPHGPPNMPGPPSGFGPHSGGFGGGFGGRSNMPGPGGGAGF